MLSHLYHHNYSENRQRSMRIHSLFCFWNLHGSSHLDLSVVKCLPNIWKCNWKSQCFILNILKTNSTSISRDFALETRYVLRFVEILRMLILRNTLQLASTGCQDSLIKSTQHATLCCWKLPYCKSKYCEKLKKKKNITPPWMIIITANYGYLWKQSHCKSAQKSSVTIVFVINCASA